MNRKFFKRKQSGVLAIGMSFIFAGGVLLMSLMSKQRELNTSMALNQQRVKNVLFKAVQDAVREMGAFVPVGLLRWDGTNFTKSQSAPEDMSWENSGANLRKYGCVNPVSNISECGDQDKYRIIARVISSPSRTLANGQIEDYLKIELKAEIHKKIFDATLENSLKVLVKRGVTTAGANTCPYLDDAVPFVQTYLNTWYFIGWTKMKPLYDSTIGDGYTVRMHDWRQVYHRYADDNWTFPRSNASVDTKNYIMKMNDWWSWASLVIPKAKPQECYLHVMNFRLNALGHGCFAAGTEIAVSTTATKPVESLKKGDLVYNPQSRKQQKIKKIVAGPEEDKDMVEISFGHHTLTVTIDHPMYTRRGLIQAGQLLLGDFLLRSDGTWVSPSVRRIPSKGQVVYNFTLEGEGNEDVHMIAAGSFVTGDLYLQNKLIENQNQASLTLE